jgi:hypothetical protein
MLSDEKVYGLDELAAALPVPRSRQTLWRWIRHGLNGVKLEHTCDGRGIVTSAEAVDRFLRQVAQQRAAVYEAARADAASKAAEQQRRDADLRLIDSELDAAGI